MADEQEQQAAEAAADEKKEVEVPEKFKGIVEQIEQMSVLDLSELVSLLEDKFGVSSAGAPMMMPGMMPGAGGGEEGAAEEKSEFDVELTDVGSNKIAVIKAIRAALPDLGLKDAKEMADNVPAVMKEALAKEEAEEMKKNIEEAGGTVTLK